jgi:DNA-binding FadR family transcriptional regulator
MDSTPLRRRPRSLALDLVDAFSERMRDGRLPVGDKLPSEQALMAEFNVSRTVVREALSKLQASRQVVTRHGIGTFVAAPAAEDHAFRVAPEQFDTLRDVIALLELRAGVESEAAGLAAQRRSDDNLAAMRRALETLASGLAQGEDAVNADFQFHLEIARATQNPHFAQLMSALGSKVIPRVRLQDQAPPDPQRLEYLHRVQQEHESIFDAIAARDSEAARAAMRMHLVSSRERRRRASALTGS